jgi:hypothetical protein
MMAAKIDWCSKFGVFAYRAKSCKTIKMIKMITETLKNAPKQFLNFLLTVNSSLSLCSIEYQLILILSPSLADEQ